MPVKKISAGRRRHRVLLAAVIAGGAATLAMTGATAQNAGGEAPAVDPAISDEQGQILYGRYGCSDCHQIDGAGELGPALAGNRSMSDQRFIIGKILTGGGDMPPFDTINNTDIAAIVNYIRHVFNNFNGTTTPDIVQGQRGPAE